MQDKILELSELQEKLEWLLRKDLLEELVNLLDLLQKSSLGTYKHRLSTRGEDCEYTIKAKELFNKLNKKDIFNKINEVIDLIHKVKVK